MLLHTAYAGLRVALSLRAISLHASPFTIGMLMSLLALLPAMYSVGAGRLIDRIGVRAPMLVAACGVCAAATLAAALPQLAALFAVSLLASGFMLYHIAIHHVIGVTGDPGRRVRSFSMLALAFSTATFVGPMIVGFLIDGVGYRWTFVVMALFAAAATIAIWRVRIELPKHPDSGRTRGKRHITDLLRIPLLRRVFVSSALLSMTWDLYTFVLPIYGTRIGLSASQIGLALAAFGGATALVRLLIPLVERHLHQWTMLIGSMAVPAGVFVVFPYVENVALLGVLGFVLGLGLGSAQPMVLSLIYELTPAGRGGEAVGVRSLLITGSQTTIPLLFGALGAAVGMAPVFWTMALCLAGGAFYARKRPPE